MPWTAAPREVIPVAVVQPALERDVAQRVDVAVGIAVVVEGQVVRGEPQQPRADVDVGEHRHVVDGGLGVVGRGPGVQREAQGDGGAVPHEPGGRHDMCGVEMVQRPALVLFAPAAPGADGVEEHAELAGAEVQAPAAVVSVMAY